MRKALLFAGLVLGAQPAGVYPRTDAVRIVQTFLEVDTAVAIVEPDARNFFAVVCSGLLEVFRNGLDQTAAYDYDLSLNPAGVVFRQPVVPGDIVKTRCFRGN